MSRVLLAEDDRHIALLVELALEDPGTSVEVVTTGPAVVQRLATEPLPDVLLLDLMLPGMSGFEVLGRLRASSRTERLPVLVLSAQARAEDRAEVLRRGANAFLAKPFDVDELARIVGSLVRESASPGGAV